MMGRLNIINTSSKNKEDYYFYNILLYNTIPSKLYIASRVFEIVYTIIIPIYIINSTYNDNLLLYRYNTITRVWIKGEGATCKVYKIREKVKEIGEKDRVEIEDNKSKGVEDIITGGY